MFDDPKKELQALEDQLLAAELNHEAAQLNDDEFETFYENILAEFGPRENPNGAAVSTEAPPIRNFANGYGGTAQAAPADPDGDEILEDSQPAQPRKGIKGLVFLACLECLGIVGVAAYWAMHFL